MKVNRIPECRTPISERSDAGLLIDREVLGFLKERHPERSEGSMADAGIAVWRKGSSPSPLRTVEPGPRFVRYGFARHGLAAHRIALH